MGRIDNRGELRAALRLDDGRPLDDGALVLEGYRRWGTALPERLLGDFSFLIRDPAERRAFGARDHMGVKPYYYSRDGTCLLFSTDLAELVARVPGARINHEHLAMSAICLLDLASGGTTTPYKDVFSLPGGSAVCLDDRGLKTWEYWRPDAAKRLGIPDGEAPAALRELIFSAVEARLPAKSAPAALLSGGLDSSAVVAVAAMILKKKNRALDAFSAVLDRPSSDGTSDESGFIRELACFENIRFNRVTDAERGPFDDVAGLVGGSATPFHTSRHYLYAAFAQAARARGASTLLDGGFGELGPSAHGAGYYPELFRAGRWALLAKELKRRAQVDNQPAWRVAARHLALPLTPRRLLALAGRDHRRDLQQWADQCPLANSYVEKTLGARKAELLARVVASVGADRDHRRMQARNIILMQRRAADPFISADPAPLELLFPFLDKRIIEFCLSAPGHLKVRGGYARSLIRLALDGVLPKAIQWRTSKEPFSPDYHRRYNRQRPCIARQLESIASNDPVRKIVDVPRLLAMARVEMKSNRCGTPGDFMGMQTVPYGIYLIAFLRRFPEFQA
ncbi:MAG: hypothetical protein KGO96_05240 [Elusimicrobia bacterium]|nr:hypothetical protein [Elusimicrobiota bacterium]MDE2425294.1 hypothetical protein [Elusimicrobiota bacterium]